MLSGEGIFAPPPNTGVFRSLRSQSPAGEEIDETRRGRGYAAVSED